MIACVDRLIIKRTFFSHLVLVRLIFVPRVVVVAPNSTVGTKWEKEEQKYRRKYRGNSSIQFFDFFLISEESWNFTNFEFISDAKWDTDLANNRKCYSIINYLFPSIRHKIIFRSSAASIMEFPKCSETFRFEQIGHKNSRRILWFRKYFADENFDA